MITTKLAKGELVNHPVRLGIIEALVGTPLTPKQLGDLLPEIPQATLYRQLKVLLGGEIIEVVDQRQVNGILESTYALRLAAAQLTKEEYAAMSPEDHKACLALLAGRSVKAIARYVDQPHYDLAKEGTTYFTAQLHLTDKDARQLKRDLLDLTNRYCKEAAVKGRNRLLTISLIPEPE